jgi:hypothetical protein
MITEVVLQTSHKKSQDHPRKNTVPVPMWPVEIVLERESSQKIVLRKEHCGRPLEVTWGPMSIFLF